LLLEEADILWVQHDYHFDLILSTSLEVYQDRWKNLKGSSTAALLARNESLEIYVKMICDNFFDMEKDGPSEFFRKNSGERKTILALRPVDMLVRSGEYSHNTLAAVIYLFFIFFFCFVFCVYNVLCVYIFVSVYVCKYMCECLCAC
jgi:hypothetical protein